jgi:type IV fimbrial biogenesis protein FimT
MVTLLVHVPARRRGFTLPEVLAVVAIIAILAGVGAPAMGGLVAGQRARMATSDVYTALVQARSEAIKRNAEVTLLPVTSGHWEAGWSIPNPTDSGHPLANHAAISGGTISGPDSVVYLANGRVKGDTPPQFEIAITNADSHRCVQVDLSGRPLMKTTGC